MSTNALPAYESHLLWPDGAPRAVGNSDLDQPALTVHLPPKDRANGCGVIIAPGGGYLILASDHEGLQVAQWLNEHGIAAFVLRYRVRPAYWADVSLLDGQRAVRWVRHNAQRFGVSEDRIGMLGFSAGGHLVTAVGTRFADSAAEPRDAIDQADSRPNFIVPIYPAIDETLFDPLRFGKMANGAFPPTNIHVTAQTPPAFVVQTHEDPAVLPQHALLFYRALLDAAVPAELHVFGYGTHGLGLAPGDPDFNEWTRLLLRWLRRSGFLTSGQRVPVQGRVAIDGEPVVMGWVTLVPDDECAPLVCAYLVAQTPGVVAIDAAHGAVPGRYRVEVHRVGSRWPLGADGAYSQASAECYTRQRPQDDDVMRLVVAEGATFAFDVQTT